MATKTTALARSGFPMFRPPAPIIIRQSSPGSGKVKRAAGHAKRHISKHRKPYAALAAAGLLGLSERVWPTMPTIPILGRAGTAALVVGGIGYAAKSETMKIAALGLGCIALHDFLAGK